MLPAEAVNIRITVRPFSLPRWVLDVEDHRHRLSPPPAILRMWATGDGPHGLGWSNRTYRRVPLSQVRRLWRQRVHRPRVDFGAEMYRRTVEQRTEALYRAILGER